MIDLRLITSAQLWECDRGNARLHERQGSKRVVTEVKHPGLLKASWYACPARCRLFDMLQVRRLAIQQHSCDHSESIRLSWLVCYLLSCRWTRVTLPTACLLWDNQRWSRKLEESPKVTWEECNFRVSKLAGTKVRINPIILWFSVLSTNEELDYEGVDTFDRCTRFLVVEQQ